MTITIDQLADMSDDKFLENSASIERELYEENSTDDSDTSQDTNQESKDNIDTNDDSSGSPEDTDKESETDSEPKDDSESSPDSTDDTPEPDTTDTQTDEPDSDSSKEPSNKDTINYEEAYKKIMAPFKANGKEIKLESPEEVIQLMQQGANYTKKMQELSTYRKAILMLQRNNLLNESDLSFLIDLHKKDPNAINKFFKDNNIDPFGVDPEKADDYLPGKNIISDKEAAFKTALDDVSTLSGGKDLLVEMSKWDSQSQQVLYENPELVQELYNQKSNGIYNRINSEIDKLKLLGQIPSTMPYLQAYKVAGDLLVRQEQNRQVPLQPNVAINTTNINQVNPQIRQTNSVHKTDPEIDKKIRATGSPKSNNMKKSSDILELEKDLELDDDAFLEKYEKLMQKLR